MQGALFPRGALEKLQRNKRAHAKRPLYYFGYSPRTPLFTSSNVLNRGGAAEGANNHDAIIRVLRTYEFGWECVGPFEFVREFINAPYLYNHHGTYESTKTKQV